MSRQFVIIGLGQLGSAMLGTLLSLGHEVLGIDSDEDLVQDLSEEFPMPTWLRRTLPTSRFCMT